MSTELDTSVVRQKFFTNQVLGKCWTGTGVHHFAQNANWEQELPAEHDLRSFGPKTLLKQKLHIVLMMNQYSETHARLLTAYQRVQM